jgi:putative molybdopterin biosynthesis protein
MTIQEVSEYLKMSDTKVYQLARRGEMPCTRIGKSVRILKTELDAWLKSNSTAFVP